MTTSTGGMVASSQRLASEAGAAILRRGGGAVDACVAMDAVLHVTEPASTGLGGDMFALVFEAPTRIISAINGSGRAPRARALGDVARDERGVIPAEHGDAVTVPGVCAGWFDLAARYATFSVAELLQPAIEIAESGFAVAPVSAALWDRNLAQLQSSELTIDGRAPRSGETFRNPPLAHVLRQIASSGPGAFYRGEIAERVAAAARAAGGAMTADDLAAHRSTWETPISTRYGSASVWECPPNGQGLAALIGLAILAGTPLGPVGSAKRVHLQIEALRLAFADARWFVTDPAFGTTPVRELLSPEYVRTRRLRIDPDRAATDVARGAPNGIPGTVYHCAVDAMGNACSYVSSHFAAFGSGIVPAGLGFPLQNRGCGFSLDPRHPNAFAPGKRPYHTIIPGMLTREDGTLWGPFGVMGGPMQPQGHLQVVNALVDDGASPQEALDRPRFFIEPEIDGGRVYLESGMPSDVADGLRARGHDVVADPPTYGRSMFGRGQVIL
ncbi:MAG TPA: gamma-glutamyltransferase family protein, partial [Gemmatimonadaceae bacterium]|nr:gamma-glutamyltransferase family protein [Gemmatimonadaceae bacterium]